MSDIAGLLEKYKHIEGERFFHEMFVLKEYRAVLDKPASVVVDIGALAGEFGAYIYDKADVIYAVEADSKGYAEMIQNIEEFGLDKIKPFHLAIGDFNGEGQFNLTQARGGNRLEDSGNHEIVTVRTLATFLKENNIDTVDILKIDVEDNEVEIFNAPDIGVVLPRIKVIIGEHLEKVKDTFLNAGFTETKADGQNIMFER